MGIKNIGLPRVHVVGGGLAGSEAAYQLLRAGIQVVMHEMRPVKMTPAHTSGNFAELVCSNSLKSMDPGSPAGQLKKELLFLNSLIIEAAVENQVPAGQALAVDRIGFSNYVSEKLHSFDNFSVSHNEITEIPADAEIPPNELWVVCTGPLTTEVLAKSLIQRMGDASQLYFFDAIAPTIETDSIDMSLCYRSSRYDKGDDDYINIPMSKDEYESFIDMAAAAEKMPLHEFEDTQYFESCLPIEVMIERGRETLRFGPMKPVGLRDPRTDKIPYAVIQLRQENREGSMVSMVGFQTKMKWPEQERVFRSIPALAQANFYRLGSVHRNTYVNGPQVLAPDLSLKTSSKVLLAGQITGVEGYTESTTIGLLAGRSAVAKVHGKTFPMPPPTTIIGSLYHYVTNSISKNYQPMNANMGLLPELSDYEIDAASEGKKRLGKADRKQLKIKKAEREFKDYLQQVSR